MEWSAETSLTNRPSHDEKNIYDVMYALLVVKYSFALRFQGSLGEIFRGWCIKGFIRCFVCCSLFSCSDASDLINMGSTQFRESFPDLVVHVSVQALFSSSKCKRTITF